MPEIGHTNTAFCERCGDYLEDCDKEKCNAEYERHLRWLEYGDGPTGAWDSRLILCAKCEWPLILHGPECEVLE